MKRIVSVLLALCFISCASATTTIPIIFDEETGLRLPLALLGKNGAAHGCPIIHEVYGDIVVSASHVLFETIIVDGELVDLSVEYLVEDEQGHVGRMAPAVNHNFSDIGVMHTSLKHLVYFPLGKPVSIKDQIHWYEFDFTTAEKAYMPKFRSAKVVNTLAGYIFFDESPVFGASGSCIFNDHQEVVGVISFLQRMDDLSDLGGGVSIDVLTEEEE